MRIDFSRGPVALCVAAVIGLGGGCVTGRPMAYAPGAPPVALGAQEGLALATVKLANVHKPDCQPHLKSLVVAPIVEGGESTRFQTVPHRASAAKEDQYEEALVTLPLAPGAYTFAQLFAGAQCAIFFGSGWANVYAPFKVEPGKALYIGRVEAKRREAKQGDPIAGSIIPLIDQSVTGFSNGTFDVRVVDNFDADVAVLKATYAPLASVSVEKAIMGAPGSGKK